MVIILESTWNKHYLLIVKSQDYRTSFNITFSEATNQVFILKGSYFPYVTNRNWIVLQISNNGKNTKYNLTFPEFKIVWFFLSETTRLTNVAIS